MHRLILLVLLCIATNLSAKAIIISDYQRSYIPVYTKDGSLSIAIRVFKRNAIPSVLLVNTNTLKTSIAAQDQLSTNLSGERLIDQQQIARTNYYQLLERYSKKPYLMENYGITHAKNKVTGNILTVDLCPSTAFFEKEFFDQLASLAQERPIPVAIAISGMWLSTHPKEFKYLLSLQQANQLDITWVNHSFSHAYYNDSTSSKNFLLSKMIKEDREILLTEQYLLEANQVPSVFFRFPGLVSNEKLIMKTKYFGLLPLGADAWLAIDQVISPGGIILVHGNGNEHDGITQLRSELKHLDLIDIKLNI